MQAKQSGLWKRIPSEIRQILSDAPNQSTSPATSKNSRGGKNDPQAMLYDEIKKHLPEARSEEPGLVEGRRFRADIYLPSSRLVIEIDGYRSHALSLRGFKATLERQNLLVANGYRILRYYNQQIKNDMPSVIEQITELHKTISQQNEKKKGNEYAA
ncbi:MAG: DUF559 domain-containing protein [Thiotrichales bacterium]|nr:DUF559 domain-containing protein [Thiotrichales bacterium]